MHWFVIGTSAQIEVKCPDEPGAQQKIIEFILDDIQVEGTDFEDYTIFRGESFEIVPPKDKHTLRCTTED